ncbi:MAG: glycoside hydrolase family 27 protein [Acidobacteriaceae bacterium]
MRSRFPLLLFSLLLALPGLSTAQIIAATPPMGWNSWDSFGLTVTQPVFEQEADYMHQHLQKYGWQYVVIDEGWFARYPDHKGTPRLVQGYDISPNGLYLPAPNRFPSGLKAIATYVHSLGLKFGIHIIHGIPRSAVEKNLPILDSKFTARQAAHTTDVCAWNSDNYGVKDNAAGQAYYDSMIKMYASWGVDFLKVDCISQPYNAKEIEMIHKAILKTGRPIVLSLSPGPTPLKDGLNAVRNANMWRISNDMWDVWSKPANAPSFPQSLTNQFTLLADWVPFRGPGHWPDADMLPIGTLAPHPGWGKARVSRLNHNEEQTLVTLWSIAKSPLIMGGNLLKMDPYTLSLLTNPQVIAVDQHSYANHPLMQNANGAIWAAAGPHGDYIALFNFENKARFMSANWSQSDLHGPHPVADLWAHRNLGVMKDIHVEVPPHGTRLLLIEH